MKSLKKRTLSWADITITLVALEIMSYFYFGKRTLIIVGTCMLVSFVTDWIAVWAMKKKYVADDLMSLADGMAIALMMPASVDLKIPVISCVFAVLIGKNLFGGRKNIIFSPCAVGYLFALTSWGNKILMYPSPSEKLSDSELTHSLSYSFNNTGKISVSDFDLLIGNFQGAMGTVSILLLIIISFMLLIRKAISSGAFIGVLAGMLVMSYSCPIGYSRAESLKYIMVTNMFLFASIYIVSDKRVAPINNYYAFFYGLFTAIVSYIVLITTAKENMIVTVSVIMTPVALILKEVQTRSDERKKVSKENQEKFQSSETEINKIAEEGLKEIKRIGGV